MSEPGQVYNTPPNGDFARYVDQLAQQSAARLAGAAQPTPASIAVTSSGQTSRPGMQLSRKPEPVHSNAPVSRTMPAGSPALSFAPFFGHLKWLVALWVGLQLLGHFVSWASFLFIPLLALYVAWAVMRFRRSSLAQGDLRAAVDQVFTRVRQAAADARQHQQRNKPPGT